MGLRSFHSCGGYGQKKQKTRSTRNQKTENIPAELEKNREAENKIYKKPDLRKHSEQNT
jgi:hypothetical protein